MFVLQDWLNTQMNKVKQLQTDLFLGEKWLKQMGEAASRVGINVQYCMALPREVMTALEIPAVTQVCSFTNLESRTLHYTRMDALGFDSPSLYGLLLCSRFYVHVNKLSTQERGHRRRPESGNQAHPTSPNAVITKWMTFV